MRHQEHKQLSLVKGRERFVFEYDEGSESELIGSFVELAGNPDCEFDWFDAAVLSYEMGRRIEIECRPAEAIG